VLARERQPEILTAVVFRPEFAAAAGISIFFSVSINTCSYGFVCDFFVFALMMSEWWYFYVF
jgi:hypothetical protein